jgi:hypothetical protein
MRARLDEAVFSTAGHRYDWMDVVLWAKGWDGWARFERSVRLGLACARRVEEDEEAADPDESLVETAASEFRYAAGLLSAEEMEGWLTRSGLTAEEWMASMERGVLARRWSGEASETLATFPVGDDVVEAALWCEGICSGDLDRWARALAGRASVYERLRKEIPDLDQALDREAGDAPAPKWDDIVGTAPRLPREACEARVLHLARLELALRRFTARVLTPDAIRHRIGARYLDWIRLDCDVLSVTDEQAAREAALSVRADGQDLHEVAMLVDAEVRDERIYLGQADPAAREALLSAGKGDLVGPLPVGDELRLVLVRDKVMPSEADPEIRRWAEEDLVARRLAREIEEGVEWLRPIADDPR